MTSAVLLALSLAVSAFGWWVRLKRSRYIDGMLRDNRVVIARITHALSSSYRWSSASHAVIQYQYEMDGVVHVNRATCGGRVGSELPVLVRTGHPDESVPVRRLPSEGWPGVLTILSAIALIVGLMFALLAVIVWLSPDPM